MASGVVGWLEALAARAAGSLPLMGLAPLTGDLHINVFNPQRNTLSAGRVPDGSNEEIADWTRQAGSQ